ncbi:MAG: hypothetical protein ACTSXQ_06775 [Alphaproteobacteria bacterium]
MTHQRILFSIAFGFCALLLSLSAVQAAAFIPGGNLVTPTVYRLTVKKIEFQDTEGGIATFYTGASAIDIAAANPGESVGEIEQNGSLSAGTYTGIRITISRTFGINAVIADIGGGIPCRTSSANAVTSLTVPFAINDVPQGATDAALPQTQNVTVPLDATLAAALAAEGYSFQGDDMISSFVPVTAFTVDETGALPATQIDFDVTNAAELSNTGAGICAVLPQAPTITVTM